jgi:hypothetical protein
VGGAEIRAMATVEVSRTLVKSPPELWEELQGERLREALGAGTITPTENERLIVWEGDDSKGTAILEPSGWGTKVTLRAELEEPVTEISEQVTEIERQVAKVGLWARIRGVRLVSPPEPEPEPETDPEAPRHENLEQTLEQLLDDLGSAHKRPFQAE